VPNNACYIRTTVRNENLNTLQVEIGDKATSYAEYKTPIELCKAGEYQDYIYKDNGSWYIHKEIGKFNMEDLSPYVHNATYWQSNFNAENGIMSIRVGKSNFPQLNILDIANRWKSTSFTYGGG
jgi:hypothetical protein